MTVLVVDVYPGDALSDFVSFWKRYTDKDVLWAHDEKQELVRNFRILSLGQTVIVDRRGEILYNGSPLEYNALKRLVEEAA